jgi:hypothetical protein
MIKRALAGLFAVAMIVAAGCDGDGLEEDGTFEVKLRGTWETLNPGSNDYRGTLAISRDTITITGYDQPAYFPLKESERPFKGITEGVVRKGYSADGKIYINDFGWAGIAYGYEAGEYPDYTKLLRFTFGGRPETLRKTGE